MVRKMDNLKLKAFLFNDKEVTNNWLIKISNKTGFTAELETDTHYGSLCYENSPCYVSFTINRSIKQIILWPHLLAANREILKHSNDERLSGNMTTDEFVDFCLRIKQIFKQQKVNAKLKEMRKDFRNDSRRI
jgi:hypothetical protein